MIACVDGIFVLCYTCLVYDRNHMYPFQRKFLHLAYTIYRMCIILELKININIDFKLNNFIYVLRYLYVGYIKECI